MRSFCVVVSVVVLVVVVQPEIRVVANASATKAMILFLMPLIRTERKSGFIYFPACCVRLAQTHSCDRTQALDSFGRRK